MPSTRKAKASTRRDSTVAPTITSCELRSACREGKKKDQIQLVAVLSVPTIRKTRALTTTKICSVKKRTPETFPNKRIKKKLRSTVKSVVDDDDNDDGGGKLPASKVPVLTAVNDDDEVGHGMPGLQEKEICREDDDDDDDDDDNKSKKNHKEAEETGKKVSPLFSTANTTSPIVSMLLKMSKSTRYVDVSSLNHDACINGEAFVGTFKATGESFLLADPQSSPTIVCMRCGKICKSFDTFTKSHKYFYPQKYGPNHTKEKPQIKNCKSAKDPFFGNCQDYWHDSSQGVDGEWAPAQVNVNAQQTKWQKINPELVQLVEIDDSSLDVCVSHLPPKWLPHKKVTFNIYHLT